MGISSIGTSGMPVVADGRNVAWRSAVRIVPDSERVRSWYGLATIERPSRPVPVWAEQPAGLQRLPGTRAREASLSVACKVTALAKMGVFPAVVTLMVRAFQRRRRT